ncbi:MAG: Oxidoreductase [Parcubacteria bacterium C7867-008]|nr:MAG: Oxidoreductase [Parcubacteria bacterium C7867-008]
MSKSAPILTLNLGSLTSGDPERVDLFVESLRKAFGQTGFLFLENHGISQQLIEKATRAMHAFFTQLTPEQRSKYIVPGSHGQMGYTPMNIERAEGAATEDLKHFWHTHKGECPDVEELPSFTLTQQMLYEEFTRVYRLVMQGVALSLGLPGNHFDFLEGDSLTRALHYPAHDNPQDDDAAIRRGGNIVGMCAAAHTDINMLTLLLAREPGLQLWHEGEWMSAHITNPNVLIVNVGDMLEHLTGGRYRSGKHRVVCQPGLERFSVPHFGHVRGDTSIVPLAHLGPSDLEIYHFQTAGEFLLDRLAALGLLSKE